MSSAELVSFFSDGYRLDARFYATPAAANGASVVFCPGSRVSKETPYYHDYIPRLVEGGLNVLLFDYRGWGKSEGTRGELYPEQQIADVRNAVSYLQTRDDADPGRIGVFGVSFGGALGAGAAARDERIRAVVTVLAPMDGAQMLRGSRREYEWVELLGQLAEDRRTRAVTGRGGETEHFSPPTPERQKTTALSQTSIPPIPLACLEAITEFRPLDHIDRIAPRALLLIAATRDPTCPVEHSRLAFAAAGSPKRLVEIDSAEHYGTYVKHMDHILDESISWFGRHLDPTGPRVLEA
ncbi:MAG TPA: alpha/beta fold hydrolase [Candidatus Limnocylindria bacterium]